jgi:hypothetical protein
MIVKIRCKKYYLKYIAEYDCALKENIMDFVMMPYGMADVGEYSISLEEKNIDNLLYVGIKNEVYKIDKKAYDLENDCWIVMCDAMEEDKEKSKESLNKAKEELEISNHNKETNKKWYKWWR